MFWDGIFTYDNLTHVGISAGIFLLFLLLRKLFTKYIFSILLKVTQKTRADFFTTIFLAFEKPAQWLFIIIGLFIAMIYFPFIGHTNELFLKIIRSFIIIMITWGLYNLASSSSVFFTKMNKKYQFDMDNILIPLLSKAIRFIIIAISITAILQEFDYEISGFIAGLGLGGLAISLAAKDALANMFGGVVIIMEKPFRIGDWIMTPSVEGTVEEITFRSTKIRTFTDALVTVPNATLANETITNWSKMGKRQISFDVRFPPDTPSEKLQDFIRQMDYLLKNHPGVDQETILVNFDKYEADGLDVFLYFFTKTTVWKEYLEIKEEINFNILDLLKDEASIEVVEHTPDEQSEIEGNQRADVKLRDES
ncbi:mechanosensitive ion channel family protein [Oceanobacillus polygoni]|uniref:MscS family membrane protein n=1 Tax=Oceanobacillus polygoni TaxID=1235259 RepID=A0A9X1CIV6_9BACI|nr:mechanosensitive ion channel family protein [Oceanobacillus polygoni]MBP2079465.1 MscS family membrane protein [Oceanobacillus polygoni]